MRTVGDGYVLGLGGLMDARLFRRVGESLYGAGHHWPELLAIDLSVGTRTAQRWASGTREIPDLEPELAALVHERARELAALADELSTATADSGSVR